MKTTNPKRHDLVFYSNRSTPHIVHRDAPSIPKEGYGQQTLRRHATEEEEKEIAKGKWLRVDELGNRPSHPNYKKTLYRPALLVKKTPIEKKAEVVVQSIKSWLKLKKGG